MGNWLKQNGGALALLFVGLGIAGFQTRYGWVVVGIAIVWFVVEQVRRFRSWEPTETAVPGQWLSAVYPTDDFRELWLGCRGAGYVFGALRCEVYHPIGRTVVALHRGRVILPRPEHEKTVSPWRDFAFAYPSDFSAKAGVPLAVSGTYQVTWLGRKVWSGTTVMLTTETHHLQVPQPGPAFPDLVVRLKKGVVAAATEAEGLHRVDVKVQIVNRSSEGASLRCWLVVHNEEDTVSTAWSQREAPIHVPARRAIDADFHVMARADVLSKYAEESRSLPHAKLIRVKVQELLSETERYFDATTPDPFFQRRIEELKQ
jgi:hypothetical protein